MIETYNLNKTYKAGSHLVHAVRDVNMRIEFPETVCLFGRSGSGKTSLLNLIGTLDKPDSGKVIFDGKDILKIPANRLPIFRRRNIGFVFQHFNLIPYLTALENVALPLKFDGVTRPEREKRARAILSDMGLSNRLDFRLSQLSGGQIQRVAFARALVNRPTIVLADEPTGHLDSTTATDLARLIAEMNKRHQISFLIATHDPIISSVSDRTIYIEDGSIKDEKKYATQEEITVD